MNAMSRSERSSWAWLDSFRLDLKHAVRMFVRWPAFSLAAICSLSLGIAANTTIFSIIDATLLGSLPVEHLERLVTVSTATLDEPTAADFVSVNEYRTWRDQSRSFEALGARFSSRVRYVGGEAGNAAEEVIALQLNPETFKVFGIRPSMGRLFDDTEDVVGAPAPVVVVSDRFWRRRLGADRNAIGGTLRLDGVTTTVIGVIPTELAGVVLAPDADVWVPWGLTPSMVESAARFNMVFGRLRPGVSLEQAQAEMDTIARRMAETFPERNRGRGIYVERLQQARFGDLRRFLLVLQGAVILVLLIACSNTTGLLVARASDRQSEMALRRAVGASRGRLIVQGLTEGMVLSALGGIAGVFLAWGGIQLFLAVAPADIPGIEAVRAAGINARVLGFTAALTVLTAVVFGLVPAFRNWDSGLSPLLRESSNRTIGNAARTRFRLLLLSGQTALALILLVGAGLMINSYLRLRANPLGAEPAGVLSFSYGFAESEAIEFVGRRYQGFGLWRVNPLIAPTLERVRERLQAIPGVEAVAGVNGAPFRATLKVDFDVPGKPQPPVGSERPAAEYFAVTPGYFEIMKIRLLQGRYFDERDNERSRKVVIINETLAQRFWPNEDPIGRHVRLDFVPDEEPREVIAVVANVLIEPFQQSRQAAVYVPHLQQTALWRGPYWGLRARMFFLVRGNGEPMRLAADARNVVGGLDSTRPVTRMQAVQDAIAEQLKSRRLYVLALAAFALVATVLASIGIYGVVAHSVSQRVREIGIRAALGARKSGILRIALQDTFVAVFGGIVVGVLASLVLTQLIAAALWGVTPTDPVTIGAVAVGLLCVAFLATFIPTRRALSVDPSVILRGE